MIIHLTVLLAFQLVGEVLSRGFSLPLPGPVIGMALLFLTLIASPPLAAAITPTARALLAHLSLLFVPAGVGVIQHLALFAANPLAIGSAVIGATVLSLLAGVGAFLAVARLTGSK